MDDCLMDWLTIGGIVLGALSLGFAVWALRLARATMRMERLNRVGALVVAFHEWLSLEEEERGSRAGRAAHIVRIAAMAHVCEKDAPMPKLAELLNEMAAASPTGKASDAILDQRLADLAGEASAELIALLD